MINILYNMLIMRQTADLAPDWLATGSVVCYRTN